MFAIAFTYKRGGEVDRRKRARDKQAREADERRAKAERDMSPERKSRLANKCKGAGGVSSQNEGDGKT